jgi:hypothetical protein
VLFAVRRALTDDGRLELVSSGTASDCATMIFVLPGTSFVMPMRARAARTADDRRVKPVPIVGTPTGWR